MIGAHRDNTPERATWPLTTAVSLWTVFIGLSILFLKFRRIVFRAIGVEFLVLGVILHVSSINSIFILLFIWLNVVSSIFILAMLCGLVKSVGRDFSYFT